MPINPIVLQRRHAELGRIRLGDQKATNNGGTRPNKLDRFRFTSVSERYISDLADLYGGTAQKWDNNGIPSWEVYTEAQTIPVIAVKNGLTQWMEFWSGGGCIHRCDGVTNQLTGEACDLDEQVKVGRKTVNPHEEAKPTTRLSVMLPELEAIGVWRMESHGWNAAAEIPAVAELAAFVGDLVPANLHLVERRAIKDGQTSRFVVPVLDLQIGTERLKQIVEARVSGGELPPAAAAHIEGGRPQITAGDPYAALHQRINAAQTRDDLQAIWDDALAARLAGSESEPGAGRDGFFLAFQQRSQALAPPQQVDADGVVEGELVDDEDAAAAAEQAWSQVLKVAGGRGMSLDETSEEFSAWSGGELPADASAARFDEFRAYLEADEQVSA